MRASVVSGETPISVCGGGDGAGDGAHRILSYHSHSHVAVQPLGLIHRPQAARQPLLKHSQQAWDPALAIFFPPLFKGDHDLLTTCDLRGVDDSRRHNLPSALPPPKRKTTTPA